MFGKASVYYCCNTTRRLPSLLGWFLFLAFHVLNMHGANIRFIPTPASENFRISS